MVEIIDNIGLRERELYMSTGLQLFRPRLQLFEQGAILCLALVFVGRTERGGGKDDVSNPNGMDFLAVLEVLERKCKLKRVKSPSYLG